MLEEQIIGRSIEDIKSNNKFIVDTIINAELYEEYIITDGIDTIICSINEDNRLIPVINL